VLVGDREEQSVQHALLELSKELGPERARLALADVQANHFARRLAMADTDSEHVTVPSTLLLPAGRENLAIRGRPQA
jgi:hypothetical protein